MASPVIRPSSVAIAAATHGVWRGLRLSIVRTRAAFSASISTAAEAAAEAHSPNAIIRVVDQSASSAPSASSASARRPHTAW